MKMKVTSREAICVMAQAKSEAHYRQALSYLRYNPGSSFATHNQNLSALAHERAAYHLAILLGDRTGEF